MKKLWTYPCSNIWSSAYVVSQSVSCVLLVGQTDQDVPPERPHCAFGLFAYPLVPSSWWTLHRRQSADVTNHLYVQSFQLNQEPFFCWCGPLDWPSTPFWMIAFCLPLPTDQVTKCSLFRPVNWTTALCSDRPILIHISVTVITTMPP